MRHTSQKYVRNAEEQAHYARRLAMWILAVAPHITLDTLADDDEKGRIREIQATAVAAKAQLTSFPCEAHILRGLRRLRQAQVLQGPTVSTFTVQH